MSKCNRCYQDDQYNNIYKYKDDFYCGDCLMEKFQREGKIKITKYENYHLEIEEV